MANELLIVILVVLLIAISAVAYQVYHRMQAQKAKEAKEYRLTETLTKLALVYRERVASYRERFSIMEPHLTDYFNSIPLSSHPYVHDLRLKISDQEERCSQLDKLLSTPGIAGYERGIEQLQVLLKAERGSGTDKGWGDAIDELIQIVGLEIHAASTNQDFSLPRARNRRPTLDSLKVAGVLLPEK
jgi:hypothetical protein